MAKNTAFAASASFTRPGDTNAYAEGDLVANSTTAGSVEPMEFPGLVGISGFPVAISRIRVSKSGNVLTNAQFRLHIFAAEPTASAGDNAAFNSSETYAVASVANLLTSIDITLDKAGTAAAIGVAIPTVSSLYVQPIVIPPAGSLFALLEARAAYTPANAEVFTVTLEGLRSPG